MSPAQRFVLSLLGIVASAAVITTPAWLMRNRLPEDQFSVSAEGRVFAPPNIAEITLGVRTEKKPTAETATKENVEKMNRVIEAIKKTGVEAKDIKTIDYQLYADYNYNTPDRVRELTGWNLSQSVRVKIRNLDSIGNVIAKATAAGANEADSISFTIDDEEVLKKQARAEAITKAKAKAEELSKEAGIKLGKAINVYENYNPPIISYYSKGELGGMGGGGDIPAPSIQPGQNEVVVNVTLVYKVD